VPLSVAAPPSGESNTPDREVTLTAMIDVRRMRVLVEVAVRGSMSAISSRIGAELEGSHQLAGETLG
jgi:hypothetical protein